MKEISQNSWFSCDYRIKDKTPWGFSGSFEMTPKTPIRKEKGMKENVVRIKWFLDTNPKAP